MPDAPTTQPSLLARLRDAHDAAAWERFVDLYAPPVYGYARRPGLQAAHAADLTQEVLRSVAAAARRWEYDPRRGSFRGWLFTVVRNALHNHRTRGGRHPRGAGTSSAHLRLEALPAPAADETAAWDQECRRRLFRWAADRVAPRFRPDTWRAFWLTAVEGRPPRTVAADLGLTVAAVYLAKARVVAALRDQVRDADPESAGDGPTRNGDAASCEP